MDKAAIFPILARHHALVDCHMKYIVAQRIAADDFAAVGCHKPLETVFTGLSILLNPQLAVVSLAIQWHARRTISQLVRGCGLDRTLDAPTGPFDSGSSILLIGGHVHFRE